MAAASSDAYNRIIVYGCNWLSMGLSICTGCVLRDMSDKDTSERAYIVSTISEALRAWGVEGFELEWRLGTRQGDKFVPGLTRERWESLKAVCDAWTGISVNERETTEYIAEDGLRKIMIHNGDSIVEHWMVKTKISMADTATYRVSCSREGYLENEPAEHPPLKHMRRKHRWSYRIKWWSIDFTKVLRDLDSEDYVYECEIEVVDKTKFFVYTTDYICTYAESLLKLLQYL